MKSTDCSKCPLLLHIYSVYAARKLPAPVSFAALCPGPACTLPMPCPLYGDRQHLIPEPFAADILWLEKPRAPQSSLAFPSHLTQCVQGRC